ncbi:MAG: dihydropteroate synthase [Desulfobacterota bacterium]|nr:dihydropteroate synthase [Thermodesulfobacteriota bacterium]
MKPAPLFRLSWSEYTLDLSRRTHVMGVINVTPDSFSDGGQFFEKERAVAQGLQLAADGADLLDVGGESTRPYSKGISADEEMDRVIPVIEALKRELTIPISIDTLKAQVAREALRCGASMVNDISSFCADPGMASVAAEAGVPVILMHMKGTPADMQVKPSYGDVVAEIITFLKEVVDQAVNRGVRRERIIVDPGIGFGKTFDHNLEILKELGRFQCLDAPILVGSSRKAFIGRILDKKVHERDTGTMATVAAAVMNGAHIVRVHNVKQAVETVRVIDAIKRGRIEQ